MEFMRRTWNKRVGVLLAICWLAFPACKWRDRVPVPEEKEAFIGRWSSGPNYLDLKKDGRVEISLPEEGSFERGGLKSLDETSLCVGEGWAIFEPRCWSISKSPYRVDGKETILFGDIEFTRDRPRARPPTTHSDAPES